MSTPVTERTGGDHLDVRVRFTPVLVLIRPVGELTASQVHHLEDALEAARVQVRPEQLMVLDLSRVTQYDCHALGVLGSVLGRVLDSGIELRINDARVLPSEERARLS